ncbi:DUF4760 domain-containing protein [Luteimonas sp. TWI662]|uniref:DUF4760 domain-containing protein n=1 Tax=Luteimonas sp. TWI662 TaxID=3136789 RepID=UPI00320A6C98
MSVLTARSIARKKQTADLLFATRSDAKLQEGYNYISEYSTTTTKNIIALAEANAESSHAEAVRYVLNHLEGVEVGIAAGIYDEVMLKRMWCSIVLQTFERTQPLIAAIRRKQAKETILQEFECLAQRWKKNPLIKRSA